MIKNNFLNYILLLTFPIAMVSGLFVAPWSCAILITILLALRKDIIISDFILSKLEVAILLYAFSSSFWSIEPRASFITFLQLAMIIILARFIANKISIITIDYKKLLFGILLALVVFDIENFSHGFIARVLRNITSHTKNYHLSWMDRGCSLLSIATWPMLYMLMKEGQKLLSLILYIAVLVTLLISDNMSGLIGFMLASVGYLILLISNMRISWLIKVSMIIYIISMPIASKIQDPRFIAKEYGHVIPISYIHRLLIWNFVMTQTIDHPIIGQGIGTSKFTPVNEEDKFFYKDEMLSPLPLHPHNNVLQIFLELGLVGLTLFALYVWQILGRINNVAFKTKDKFWGAAANAAFINYFFIGMVSFGIWQSWWMLVVLLIMIIFRPKE
jgi:O-antigen ligase